MDHPNAVGAAYKEHGLQLRRRLRARVVKGSALDRRKKQKGCTHIWREGGREGVKREKEEGRRDGIAH